MSDDVVDFDEYPHLREVNRMRIEESRKTTPQRENRAMANEKMWGPPDLRERPEDAELHVAATELMAKDPELDQLVRNGQRGKAYKRALRIVMDRRSPGGGPLLR